MKKVAMAHIPIQQLDGVQTGFQDSLGKQKHEDLADDDDEAATGQGTNIGSLQLDLDISDDDLDDHDEISLD